ncbi:MAG TPA: hypothetical protein VN702_15600 [Acetobacteraceae bacterium]|nr:hypothetical protein [Acetobacteraceae bacterium]
MPADRVTAVDSSAPDQIREELERILTSDDFDASERNHAFLRYVVEETLAGRAHLIKGYSIAQSVFKRSPDFDPQLDPVVRIEASRLRRSLERYYLKVGRDDPVRIDLPKGGYVPTFELADSTVPGPADTAPPGVSAGVDGEYAGLSMPSVAIVPFRSLDADPKFEYFALGITEELFTALTRFRSLRVIAANAGLKPFPSAEADRSGHAQSIGFVLQGSVRSLGNHARITIQLLDVEDGMSVWATSLERKFNPQAPAEAETEIAGAIAAAVGAPNGAIARFATRQLKRMAPGLTAFECILRSNHYRRNPTRERQEEIRNYLEDAAKITPDDAEIWAQLAYVYLDAYRCGFSEVADRTSLLDRAAAVAERAMALDEHNAFAHLARSAVHFYHHELDLAAREGQRALALNPCDPEINTQVGWHLAFTGKWTEGMDLFRHGLALDPEPQKWCSLILAVDAFRQSDRAEALSHIKTAMTLQLPIAYVVGTAILADFGALDEARAGARSGRDVFPALFEDPGKQFRLHNLDPVVAERLMRGLERCGLAVSP